jgi:CHASE2 domain-containing sensor protein
MRKRQMVLILSISIFVACGLQFAGALDGAETFLLDQEFRIAADLTPPRIRPNVVLAVDADLAEFGAWPWDREVHARLVRRLARDGAGTKVVAFDLVFAGVGATEDGDRAFVEVAQDSGVAVVGGAALDRSGGTSRYPGDDLAAAFGAVAFLNCPVDPDGTVRRAWLVLEHEGKIWPSLPLAAVLACHGLTVRDLVVEPGRSVSFQPPGEDRITVPIDREGRMLVDFRLGDDTVDRHSYESAMSIPRALVSDIVLVGSAISPSADIRTTPLSPAVHGIEVHCTVLDSLLRGRFLREAPSWVAYPLVVAASLLAVLLCAVLPGTARLLVCLGLPLLILLAGFAAFYDGDLVVPLAAPALAAMLAAGLSVLHASTNAKPEAT